MANPKIQPPPQHIHARPPVAFRLPAMLVKAVDLEARRFGQSRNRMVEILLRRGLDGVGDKLVLPSAEAADGRADLFA